jgi:26S proteasome regulatory subunit N13
VLTILTPQTSADPPRVKPLAEPGYIYLHHSEDGLVHFCWRQRSAPLDNPGLDLVMVPEDGSFTPYEPTSSQTPSNPNKPTNGRIYVLKFASSSQRHLFWLQSRSQHQSTDPAWFSARDLKLGQIVNTLLQGEDVDVQQAIANLPSDPDGPDRDEDDDATMEDVEGQNHDPDHHRGGSGGAGPNATGGDVREEGQGAREGGADGGRA